MGIERIAEWSAKTSTNPAVRRNLLKVAAGAAVTAMFLGRIPRMFYNDDNFQDEDHDQELAQYHQTQIRNEQRPVYHRVHVRATGQTHSNMRPGNDEIAEATGAVLQQYMQARLSTADATHIDKRHPRYSTSDLDRIETQLGYHGMPIQV